MDITDTLIAFVRTGLATAPAELLVEFAHKLWYDRAEPDLSRVATWRSKSCFVRGVRS